MATDFIAIAGSLHGLDGARCTSDGVRASDVFAIFRKRTEAEPVNERPSYERIDNPHVCLWYCEIGDKRRWLIGDEMGTDAGYMYVDDAAKDAEGIRGCWVIAGKQHWHRIPNVSVGVVSIKAPEAPAGAPAAGALIQAPVSPVPTPPPLRSR